MKFNYIGDRCRHPFVQFALTTAFRLFKSRRRHSQLIFWLLNVTSIEIASHKANYYSENYTICLNKTSLSFNVHLYKGCLFWCFHFLNNLFTIFKAVEIVFCTRWSREVLVEFGKWFFLLLWLDDVEQRINFLLINLFSWNLVSLIIWTGKYFFII